MKTILDIDPHLPSLDHPTPPVTWEKLGDLEVAVSLLAQISKSAGEFGSEESSADDGDVGGRLGHRVEAPKVLDFAEKSRVIGDRIPSGSQRRNRSELRQRIVIIFHSRYAPFNQSSVK